MKTLYLSTWYILLSTLKLGSLLYFYLLMELHEIWSSMRSFDVRFLNKGGNGYIVWELFLSNVAWVMYCMLVESYVWHSVMIDGSVRLINTLLVSPHTQQTLYWEIQINQSDLIISINYHTLTCRNYHAQSIDLLLQGGLFMI